MSVSRQEKIKLAWVAASAVVLSGAFYLYTKQQGTKRAEVPAEGGPVPTGLAQNRYLTQALAQRRSDQLVRGSVSYNLDLLLKKGDTFDALLKVVFKVNHANEDLFIDFNGHEIVELFINGVNQPIQWNKLFLLFPKATLRVGQTNDVRIRIKNKYQSNGTGLHSFVDTDGKQYLYSQGESYFCNRFFPCFDQPDVKAPLKFQIVSPKEWTVISNENVELQQPYQYLVFKDLLNHQQNDWVKFVFDIADPENYTIWTFGETPSLPSYLYCVIAGEYWSVKAEGDGLPQTIYCRESLKEHMLKIKDFIFEVTFHSKRFYEQFFGVAFPFKKYDSIFVPEFNFGAMENPGCVTFNDTLCFREQAPAQQYTKLANTIAHEMAHMWFGDYVTMKWWNDLWLNESYADFISHYCLEHLNIKSIPLTHIGVLFNGRKGWGYREDQMVTTHPIAGEVENTERAENIFDGITYSKGASVMKQLLCIMGPEAFSRGCGAHFKKYAWGNATLEDLINSLDVEFKKNKQPFTLQEWQQEWIQTAGMNEILPEWDPAVSGKAVLKIHQSPALQEFPTLRHHKIKVAFFRVDGTFIVQDVLLKNEPITNVEYDGSQNYKAVLLNYEDESFVKVLLDQNSLEYFRANLHLVNDPLTRQIIWRSFFDVVRDAKISSEEYVDIVLENIPKEASDDIIQTQVVYLHMAIESMTPRNAKRILSTRVFDFIVHHLKKLNQANDPKLQNRLIIFRDNLFSFTADDNVIRKLLDWREGKDADLLGVPLTNQSQWSIVRLVHASKQFSTQLRTEIFNQQADKDKSDKLQRMQKQCSALVATQDQLKDLWASFLDPNNKDSVKMQAESMHGFNNVRRFQDLQEYHDKFFDVIVDVFATRSTDFAKTFYAYLFPSTDDLAPLQRRITETLAKTPASQVTLRIELAMSLDALKRKVRQFEAFGQRAKLAHQNA